MLRTSSGIQALYAYAGTGSPVAQLTDFASRATMSTTNIHDVVASPYWVTNENHTPMAHRALRFSIIEDAVGPPLSDLEPPGADLNAQVSATVRN